MAGTEPSRQEGVGLRGLVTYVTGDGRTYSPLGLALPSPGAAVGDAPVPSSPRSLLSITCGPLDPDLGSPWNHT